ncbi:MAG: hypothetical protein FJ090_10235 [Deltaproteobacteria bacterium]|nr:hypothetical protein [Deltaproteobacteria bacterium]
MFLLACWKLLYGCRVAADDFTRTASLPPVEQPRSTPPAADDPSQERLYQLLYAGELGGEAFAQGQRARMLVWLASMGFESAQLVDLLTLVGKVRVLDEADRVATAAIGLREAELYGPVYAEITALYTTGTPVPEAALDDLARRLSVAREAVAADGDPHAAQLARTRASLDLVSAWVEGLARPQRYRLSQCRFFLNHRLGPLLNPQDYGEYTGIDWDGGDFSLLPATARPEGEPHMNVAGLWGIEKFRAPPLKYIEDFQLVAIATMAVSEPGLAEAIEVRLGRRAAGDMSPASPVQAAGN